MSPSSPTPRWITSTHLSGVTVVALRDGVSCDEAHVLAIRDELLRLVGEQGRQKVLFDFGHVRYVDDSFIGTLLSLHRCLLLNAGRLALCNIDPVMLEAFVIMKLTRFFTIVTAPELASPALIAREVFGPEQLVTFALPWRTETVRLLAQGMLDSRDCSAMPLLADALQDAGCDDTNILTHCRHEGPHARGCWVLDLIVGDT